MDICRIPANAPEYSVDLSFKGKSALLSGGVMKLRTTLSNKSPKASIVWKVNSCDMNYLVMFYLVNKVYAFQIDLITTAGLATYTCRFIPGTFKMSLSNSTWTINAVLEVIT